MIRRALGLTLVPVLAFAQPNFDTVTVRATALRGGVYMITGYGGNIGLSTGSDAAFLVDDQYAPLTPKVLAAVKTATPMPVRFVLNTHWHFDHSGGNENMGKAGALLVAHNNVRRRMSTDQFIEFFRMEVKAAPPAALPVVTFNDSISFHINGDEVVAFHVPGAHTDTDVLVHFTKADVLHMGDLYFAAGYPFVDLSSGGNVNGLIAALDRALAICTPQTIVIPGHGPVSDCVELRTWRDMIATIRDRVRAELQRNRTLEQIKSAKVTREFDDRWGKLFVHPDQMVELVYRSLAGR